MSDEVREVTDEVVRLVRTVLGTDVLGVHRHGSAVLGGLGPYSDIDILVVTRRGTGHRQRRALLDGLLALSGPGAPHGRRPVELTVVTQPDVRPWRYPPTCDFQYGEWLRPEYERGSVPGPEPAPDLAVLLTVALLGDSTLYGQRPSELLDPVPHGDLRRAVVAGVPELLAEVADDTRNAVLTLARVWCTLSAGDIRAKDAAADWALPRLPATHRAVLRRARDVHRGEEAERWDGLLPQARAYARYVSTEIARIAPAGP